MSLALDVADVTRVLLADGWHPVVAASFYLDSYEFRDEALMVHPGESGLCAIGFSFEDSDSREVISGPLTSLLAVVRDFDEDAEEVAR